MPTSQNPCTTLLERVETYASLSDQAELKRLCAFATAWIAPQAALAPAEVLTRLQMDPGLVSVAMAAGLVQRFPQHRSVIEDVLSGGNQELLSVVLKLEDIQWNNQREQSAERLRRMFLAMAKDLRAVLILLALRVAGVRALQTASPSELQRPDVDRIRIAQDTLDVFAPLANRLGIGQLKWELEDGALAVLEPEEFARIKALLHKRQEQREKVISTTVSTLRDLLSAAGIEAEVNGRSKHLFSIFKKMRRKQVNFDQILDLSAVRILTNELAECYAALGIVHSKWMPLPGTIKDYIAMPKANGYQSLHTVVMGPLGRPVEVQIRTREMHDLAEHGVAAHWAYKEQVKPTDGSRNKFLLLRKLLDWQKELGQDAQLADALQTDLFEDQVYVFTPKGEVVDLPQGATPLDFAYRIHTQVGHRCRGARVNDQIESLDYRLQNGDRVEVLTQKQPQPRQDWMNPQSGFLKTASARTKVRTWFRQQQRGEATTLGKELVQRELRRLDLEHVPLEAIATACGFPTPEELFAAVGFGDKQPHSAATAALELERRDANPELPPSVPPARLAGSTTGLMMQSIDDIAGQRAGCCNAVPGDDVIGFISRGRGLVIHRRDCERVLSTTEPERLVEIAWGPGKSERHRVDIEVRALERADNMSRLCKLLQGMGAEISSAKTVAGEAGSATLRFTLGLRSAEQLAHTLERLENDKEVISARRVTR